MRAVQFALVMIVLLNACSSRNSAPIYDRSANRHQRVAESSSRIKKPSYYVVRPGDTLYAIAWRYGMDHKTLAKWNGIGPPYTIYVDQRLRLNKPRQITQSAAKPGNDHSSKKHSSGTNRTANNSPAKKPNTQPAQTEQPQTKRVAVSSDAKQNPVKSNTGSQKNSTRVIASQPAKKSPPKPKPVSTGTIQWQWPVQGRIIKSFSAADKSAKGIDIAAKRGQQVRAAAAGEVVYSGEGLIGYGQLIIIKHDDSYLSAYGHNDLRLVTEGDRVVAGQHIANVGSSGSDTPKLHFEIRRQGKPVNPMNYLPGSR